MNYVSINIECGLGNRLFKIAAMLRYAELFGHTPIFVKSWVKEPYTVFDLFPTIQVYDTIPTGTWTTLKEQPDDAYTYKPFVSHSTHVKLEGYYQAFQYIPTSFSLQNLPEQRAFDDTVFLHVRRGDYLSPLCRHHCVDLRSYYRSALGLLDTNVRILVCSDDIDWCKETLPDLYRDIVSEERWVWVSKEWSDIDTLMAMVNCEQGAICANSSFSWWGAYWSTRSFVCMPGTWGYPPLPTVRNIYPPFALVLPVT